MIFGGVAGGEPIKDHSLLINRDKPNQHPISAITGLQEALDSGSSGDGQIIVDTYADLPTDKEVGTKAEVKNTTATFTWQLVEGNPFETEGSQVRFKEEPVFQEDFDDYAEIYFEDDSCVLYETNMGGNGEHVIVYTDEENEVIYLYSWEEFELEYDDDLVFVIHQGWNLLENVDEEDMSVTSITYAEVPILTNKEIDDTDGDVIDVLLPNLEAYAEIRFLKGTYIYDGTNWNYVDRNGIVVDKFSELANYDVKKGIKAKVKQYSEVTTVEDVKKLIEYESYSLNVKEFPNLVDIPTETNEDMYVKIGSLYIEINNMFEAPFVLMRTSYYDEDEKEDVDIQYVFIPTETEITIPPEITGGDELKVTIPANWSILHEDFTFTPIAYKDLQNKGQDKETVDSLGDDCEYVYPCLEILDTEDYEKGIYQFNGKNWTIDNDVVQTNVEQDLSDDERWQARYNIGASSEDDIRDTYVSTQYQWFQEWQKSQARQNIGALGTDTTDFVSTGYQYLEEWQQSQVRQNINAVSQSEVGNDFVKYTETQYLTEVQRQIARTNIGASNFDGNYNNLTNLPPLFSGIFSDLTSKPTTIAGYGITDAIDSPSDQYITGQKTFYGKTYFNNDVYIDSNIYQRGANYITHAEHLNIKDSMIYTRDGATSSLGLNEITGIQSIKYDGINDGILAFDKDGIARVGDLVYKFTLIEPTPIHRVQYNNNYLRSGEEPNYIYTKIDSDTSGIIPGTTPCYKREIDINNIQALATREDAPINTGVARWNASTLRFETEAPDTTPTAGSTKLITSGGVKASTIPYTGAVQNVDLGDYGLTSKWLGTNSTSGNFSLNIVGDNVEDTLPFYIPNLTDQERSQIAFVQGNGRTGYYVSDHTNYIEAMFGVDENGKAFIGTKSSDGFEIWANNKKRIEIADDGTVYINDKIVLNIKQLFTRPDTSVEGDYIGQLAIYKEGTIASVYILKSIEDLPNKEHLYYWNAIDAFINNENCGNFSFISNDDTNMAGGNRALAVNSKTEAAGDNSFACGFWTKPTKHNSFFCGEYTAINNNALFAVGDGTYNTRHNIFEIEPGKAKVNGSLEVNTVNVLSAIEDLDTNKVEQRIISTNANNITVPGFYTLAGTATGVPDSTHSWFLIHQNSSATSRSQIAIGYGLYSDMNSITMYVRQRFDTSWGQWIPISGKAKKDTGLTLHNGDWNNNTQTISHAIDTSKELIVRPEYSSALDWASCNVVVTNVTATDISFACTTAPLNDLGFRIISMDVI